VHHARCLHCTLYTVCLSLNRISPSCRKYYCDSTLSYLVTPCSRVLLEKLTGLQLVKKFPAFYGTRRFITKISPHAVIFIHMNPFHAFPKSFSKIHVNQYSETNVMHFLFNLLRIMGLYMFWALLTHPQEALHKRHLVYCVRVMSVGCTRVGVELF
jgi:hypothetical protein